ncbi:MAG TPA: methyltransferase domain-containing protein [Thermomicrobiales bacterium]|nr:methyltransferase domain-containing protein [Thermomicrobiales bacterium]
MPDMPVIRIQTEPDTRSAPPPAGTYMLANDAADHARLIAIARGAAQAVREMCARAGVGAGARVVDVGCGPVGALLELAEVVGPLGVVVGLDSSAAAVATARAIVAGQNLGNVAVVHGDVNTLDLAALTAAGPFDAAHLRLVLGHQTDPAATLRRVAALLRPGGRVLVADLLAHSLYDPPVAASEQAWELLYAAARRRGLAANLGARLPRLCEEAGLRVLDARGAFNFQTPASEILALTRALLVSARAAVVGAGLAAEAEVDALVAALAAAEAQEFRSAVDGLTVQVIAAVPDEA